MITTITSGVEAFGPATDMDTALPDKELAEGEGLLLVVKNGVVQRWKVDASDPAIPDLNKSELEELRA